MVKCKLCGETFKAISWKHLKFKHGLTVAQYREMGYRTGIGAKLKGKPNLALKGRKFPNRQNSGCFKSGLIPWNKGKILPPEYGENVSRAMYAIPGAIRYGSDNTSWKGGITPEMQQLRQSEEYAEWRTAVFKRDNFTCQICNQVGGKLVAHHIKSFADFPEERFNVDNGITLCHADHSSLHNNPESAHRFPHLLGLTEVPYRQLDLF